MKGTREPELGLLDLPPGCLLQVLRFLDARALTALLATGCRAFAEREGPHHLPLVEAVAREALEARCGDLATASRFRYRSWRERLHLEEATGVGFDRAACEDGGFAVGLAPGPGGGGGGGGGEAAALRSVRLLGMGPKLLLSDRSTADQPVLRWRLRVRGNTAVEFGCVPADLPPTPTALHKCMSAPGCADHRAAGFCSQITAGSLLPLKAPVMRGTLVDLVARRGHIEVILTYPPDAKEISWHNGQPVQHPYRGPSQLRLEQDFGGGHDVRLAATCWAKGHFEVLHSLPYPLGPAWADAPVDAGGDGAALAPLPGDTEALPEALLLLGGQLQQDYAPPAHAAPLLAAAHAGGDGDEAAPALPLPAAVLDAELLEAALALHGAAPEPALQPEPPAPHPVAAALDDMLLQDLLAAAAGEGPAEQPPAAELAAPGGESQPAAAVPQLPAGGSFCPATSADLDQDWHLAAPSG